ncbi:9875_t:CDS:2, partial [Gigaspora margarita]
TLNDFKEDLYSILSSYQDKCNVHVNAKNKASKILSNFDSSFSTAEVKQFIKNLEYHEEARINVTSTYTATVLRDQQENQIFIDQLRETSSEKRKECEKLLDHLMRKKMILDDDEPLVEWEFDTPEPSWLDKIAHERDSLIYNASNYNNKMTQYELSLKIIDISDPEIRSLMSENESSELNTKVSSLLENWTTLEAKAESCLQSLEKLDNDQLHAIGEIVRPKGTHGAILELQNLLNNIKEQKVPESDNLFEDEKNNETDQHEEISPLTPDDCMNPDRHDLGRELCWGREFSLCERTGSKTEDTRKIFSNTLKVQKTLRDMHRNLIEAISADGGGTLSKPVIQASTKLLMPGFLSSYFFIRAILVIYVGGGFYASVNLADLYIPTKYQELEFIIKISRSMLQIKKLLSATISRFKQMKNRAEKEKFAPGKVAIPARWEESRSFQKPRVPKTKEPDGNPVLNDQILNDTE